MRIWGSAATLTVLGLLLAAPASGAATITVSTTADTLNPSDGHCSLREAIIASNTNAASGLAAGECPAGGTTNTVSLRAGHYKLSIARTGTDDATTGDLNVVGARLTLAGAGAGATVIDANGIDRVMTIGTSGGVPVLVTISGVTLTGGRAPDANGALVGVTGGSGGAILNHTGSLTIAASNLTANRAGDGGEGEFSGGDGGSGGAIYTESPLTVSGSTISSNTAGAGQVSGNGPTGSGGGGGGAIWSTAPVTITSSTLSSNGAGDGSPSVNSVSKGGDGGSGGAIQTSAPLTIAGSRLLSNHAGSAIEGGDGDGGSGGSGGAIETSASLSVANSTLSFNGTGSGASAGASSTGVANGGFGGLGGAIDSGGAFNVTGSTLSSNDVGVGGLGQNGGTSGTNGSGGAITGRNLVTGTLSNDTIADNGGGAAILDIGPQITLTNVTDAYNSGIGVDNVYSPDPLITLRNSLLVSNAGGNCDGSVAGDGAFTISFPASDGSCPSTFAHGDPKLATVLRDNGGLTETLALGAGSAAIDHLPATGAGCPATDQRGVQRPQGAACDIGAFELGVAPRNTVRPAIHAGGTLTCSTGNWTNFPQSFAYAWLRDGRPIAHATVAKYVLVGADVRHHLACRVTASNQTGSASAQSAALLIARPALSHLNLQPATFTPGRGTTISYTDNVAATTTFTVLRAVKGMRKGHACVKLARGVKHAKRCTRYVRVGGFSHRDRAGRVTFHFSGRVRGHKLSPGSYKLTAVPRVGRTGGRAATVRFRIKR